VLHTLRWLVGDEKFFPMLRRMAYPDPALEKEPGGRACRFATTEEIRAIAERESGLDLAWFFEVYLRQPELPVLAAMQKGSALLLEWKSPAGAPFPMPVEVQLGTEYVRVPCPEGKGRVEIGKHSFFEVDPRKRVLRAEIVAR
jgi:aminopeptidase N